MRKLFFAMLALAALASCSKDEVVQLNQDEIRYNVVAENTTKAAEVYCNNNKITTFNVWAKVGNENYIGGSGDVVTSNDNGATWTSNIKRYWPAGDVDFYAVAGMANNTITWAPATVTPASFTYTVLDDVADQEDVLYAYEQAQKPVESAMTTGTVNLNFRHALSQVVFNAKNQHPNLYIEISEVQVCGLTNSGIFNYPTSETTTNNSDTQNPHVQSPTYPIAGVGTWNVSTEDANKDKSYSVAISPAAKLNPKTTEDVTADLTAVNDIDKEFSTKAMLLLPQSQTAYDGSTGTAFFKIKCKIFNVADNTVDASSYVKTQLFGGGDGDYAYIPFSFTWVPGKKYIYTFVFGNDTNGGVEGDGDEKPDLDNPVLVNIGYTISIDEFVPVNATANWTTDGSSSSDQTNGDD